MIVTQPKTNIVASGVKGAVSFGIKEEGLAHIFNVLRNQLYSDKILAVLREYSCNAVDAHVEAGCPDKPIKVTLPNRMSLNLQIRDFGLGLSDQDIQNIYAYYGESTKRNSNAMIGQLGLGSKSAFAYGDNFVINSFCDGKKTTYNAYIDASQVGQIAKLASVSTDEANGVEIVIPVRPSDVEQFVVKAKQIYKYFVVRPQIDGQQITFEEVQSVIQGDGWKMFQYSRYGSNIQPVAVMGNIGYALTANSLKLESENENDEIISRILNSGIEVNFNIGDLDIAASREGLQYTEKTIKAIKTKLLLIKDKMVETASESLKDAPSLFSFKKMLCQFDDLSSPYYIIAKCIKTFQWKGKSVGTTLQIHKDDNEAVIRYNPRKGYVGNLGYMIKGGDLHNDLGGTAINIQSNLVVIENTKRVTGGLVNYAFNFLKEGKPVLIVTPKDAAHRKVMMDRYGFCDSDLIDIKTLQKVMLPRSTRSVNSNGSVAVKSKHLKKMFALKTTRPSYTSVQSDNWEEIDIDVTDKSNKDNYVWVEINKFVGVIGDREDIIASRLENAIKTLNALSDRLTKNKLKLPVILGVKRDKVADMSTSSIQHISKYAEEILKGIEAATNFSEVIHELNSYTKFSSNNKVLSSVITKLNGAESPNAKKLADMVMNLSHCSNTKDIAKEFDTITNILRVNRDNVMTKPSAKLEVITNKITEFADKFALLRFMDSYCTYEYRSEHKQALDLCLGLIKERDSQLASIV